MGNYFKLAALGIIALFAAMAANWGRDAAYIVHAIIILGVSGFMFIRVLRQMEQPAMATPTGYMDDVVRAGVVATTLWGVVGFLVGVIIASSWPFRSSISKCCNPMAILDACARCIPRR